MIYWQALSFALLWLLLASPADVLTFVEVQSDDENLQGANCVVLSSDGRHVYVSGAGNTIAVFARQGTTGNLSLVEVKRDGAGGVDGLDGAVSVTISPDGRHVYATGVNDNAVVVFRRYPSTGRLGWIETHRDGVGDVEGLAGADSVAVSPNGQHVYVVGDFDNAVVAFRRAETTGKLSFIEVHQDGLGGVDGLAGAEAVAVSPDGRHVYVTGDEDDAVAVFSRDGTTGELKFIGVARTGVNGVDGLAGAESIAVSPDGRHVYVTGFEDNAVVTFSRDEATGALSFVDARRDGVDGVDGLAGATAVAVSPDGQVVVVAGVADNALAVFEREQETGTLRFVEMERDGVNGVDGLAEVISVTFSADGRHVFATGWTDNAIAVFERTKAAR